MPADLKPPLPAAFDNVAEEQDSLRILSRSPHPYHRQNFELLEPSDRLVFGNLAAGQTLEPNRASPSFTKDSTPASDSGTDADDEHFLRGLPAPKTKLHKGLRGKNEPLSGSSTPLLSPAILEEEGHKASINIKHDAFEKGKRSSAEKSRRSKELIRRSTEVFLVACQGGIVVSNHDAQMFVNTYRKELVAQFVLFASLAACYPLRLVIWAYRQGKPSRTIPLSIPASFDPAPLLYPPAIPIFVSLLVAANAKSAVLPNLVLSICALPTALIPTVTFNERYNSVHWVLSCIPIFVAQHDASHPLPDDFIPLENLTLLYPLHQSLCMILHHLTTTSLLTAELQLLSVALVDLYILAHSPQAVILKGVLWGGGLGVIILCSQVIRWGVALARVPKWRFQRSSKGNSDSWIGAFWLRRAKQELFGTDDEDSASDPGTSDDDIDGLKYASHGPRSALNRLKRGRSVSGSETAPHSPTEPPGVLFDLPDVGIAKFSTRRHTLPILSKLVRRSKTHTPSGRRKRSASSSVRAFFSLTQSQATLRKWVYASYVYTCILGIILVGVREFVQRYALSGNEPVGWALGYLFGDIPWFRFQVVKANLERWICLPPRSNVADPESCYMGWVQHLRHASFGEANSRLVLSAYWLAVIVMGLAVVFQLSPIYEVDTRRKVFHFMMVAMFLPATFVDPTYASLALALMLAVFLIFDLLRASQLPPLSKPIAAFLTPYVDGRDLRGPVVISHIFLLIGCAVPLWLALAALPRTGTGYLAGWEVPTRDISMVAGVVCVGLGDAAASLIGRRWGHHKWLWGGGKSLEGSVAFASAVFVGLMAASTWLKIGGWPATAADSESASLWNLGGWLATARRAWICASMSSLTEAVLTGGNDNVVVPIVLWTCVKSFGL